MVYSFELFKHANIRYRDSVPELACCELSAMLRSLGISGVIRRETMGGSLFLSFDCRELSPDELSFLAGHSSVVFMAEQQNGLLRPLPVSFSPYLTEDLPEVLKYKGKTGVAFTRFMINTAVSLSPYCRNAEPITFFDPVCGKGTGCFCALMAGMNAVGLDADRKDLREAADYFARYLKYHRLKHEVVKRSETVGTHSLPVTEFRLADTREHYLSGDVRRLAFACADTRDSAALFRRRRPHVVVADLPYGVQHAPLSGAAPEPLPRFLRRVLPVWKQVLLPGGVIALSFNTLTLPSRTVEDELIRAGFTLSSDPAPYTLRHEVEHAVVRDVIFAFNSEEESVL